MFCLLFSLFCGEGVTILSRLISYAPFWIVQFWFVKSECETIFLNSFMWLTRTLTSTFCCSISMERWSRENRRERRARVCGQYSLKVALFAAWTGHEYQAEGGEEAQHDGLLLQAATAPSLKPSLCLKCVPCSSPLWFHSWIHINSGTVIQLNLFFLKRWKGFYATKVQNIKLKVLVGTFVLDVWNFAVHRWAVLFGHYHYYCYCFSAA